MLYAETVCCTRRLISTICFAKVTLYGLEDGINLWPYSASGHMVLVINEFNFYKYGQTGTCDTNNLRAQITVNRVTNSTIEQITFCQIVSKLALVGPR